MKNLDYENIYIEEKLRKIREKVKDNGVFLEEEQTKKTDKIMHEVLKEVYNDITRKQTLIELFNLIQKKDKEELDDALILYYYSLYNGNISLLQELLAADFNFNGGAYKLKLFVLDKMISSKFNKEEYVKILKEQESVVESFWNSIKQMEIENPEKAAELSSSFATILTQNPQITEKEDFKQSSWFCNKLYLNLLTAKPLEIFGVDYLLKAPANQKEIIDSVSDNYITETEEERTKRIKRAKNLLEKYPTYKANLTLYPKILDTFSDEELVEMSPEDAELYEKSYLAKVLPRMSAIKREDSTFSCPQEFINKSIFELLDDKTIISLSSRAKAKIVDIKEEKMYSKIYGIKIRDYDKVIKRVAKRALTTKKVKQYVKTIFS